MLNLLAGLVIFVCVFPSIQNFHPYILHYLSQKEKTNNQIKQWHSKHSESSNKHLLIQLQPELFPPFFFNMHLIESQYLKIQS